MPALASRTMKVRLVAGVSFLLALPAGCGGGAQDREPRGPNETVAVGALPRPDPPPQGCSTVPLKPFIVDVEPATRGQIEKTMHGDLAVVSYDCNGLRALENCTVAGSYRFVGTEPKRVVLGVKTEAELEAKLPGWRTNRSERLEPGGTLELTLITAGQLVAPTNRVGVKELNGICDGATHVVRGASVGAFAATWQRTPRGRVTQTTDGDLSTCPSAKETRTPPQCSGLVQLDLVPITR